MTALDKAKRIVELGEKMDLPWHTGHISEFDSVQEIANKSCVSVGETELVPEHMYTLLVANSAPEIAKLFIEAVELIKYLQDTWVSQRTIDFLKKIEGCGNK